MLVCGFTSLGAEELKSLRRVVKDFGFNCKMTCGWLEFFSINEKSDWNSLFKLLKIEKSLIPFYFKDGNKIVDLAYGKVCTREINGKEEIVKLLLLSWIKVLFSGIRYNMIGVINGIRTVDMNKKDMDERKWRQLIN